MTCVKMPILLVKSNIIASIVKKDIDDIPDVLMKYSNHFYYIQPAPVLFGFLKKYGIKFPSGMGQIKIKRNILI